MASGNHLLVQQRAGLETRIKTLFNQDLKEICKVYGRQVSGTKSVLQRRCMDILDEVIHKGNVAQFDDLRYRVNHRGQSPPEGHQHSSPSNQPATPSAGHSSYPMTPAGGRSVQAANRLPTGGRYFKPSPFYEIMGTVLNFQDLPDMPQNRNSVKATLALSHDVAQTIKNDKSIRLLVFCGQAASLGINHPIDVAFPNQVELRVNGDEIKSNYKGLKNKPGSTKPVDITAQCRAQGEYRNQISLTYALTTKRYAYLIHLARYISPETLIERIKTASVIPKQRVISDMIRAANLDADVAATSIRMSLKDPISTTRISLPVRSTRCTHNQCFDGSMFLQLQEQAPQWSCPVCSKQVPFSSLCVDKYFEDILNNTSRSTEKVDIEPNGDWTVIKEEETSQSNGIGNAGNTKARASYDDDFEDDDLIELTDSTDRKVNGSSTLATQQPSLMLPMAGGFPATTPPIPSREASVAQSTSSLQQQRSNGHKRASGAIIDLTLSEDEDDMPVRPTKRQNTTQSSYVNNTTPRSENRITHSTSSYTSAPDLNMPPMQTHQSYGSSHADNYRPSSQHSHTRQPSVSSSFTGGAGFGSTFSNSASPQSPVRGLGAGGGVVFGTPSYPQQNSRPPASRPPPNSSFAPRPPSAPNQSGRSDAQPALGLRLPPMQANPPPPTPDMFGPQTPSPGLGGWRSEYGAFSNSPG